MQDEISSHLSLFALALMRSDGAFALLERKGGTGRERERVGDGRREIFVMLPCTLVLSLLVLSFFIDP